MAKVIERAERPRNPDKPVVDRDLAGRYRVKHGEYVVPLEAEALKDAIARGLPPHEYLPVGSLLELTHEEAELALEHGVIEPDLPPRKAPPAQKKVA